MEGRNNLTLTTTGTRYRGSEKKAAEQHYVVFTTLKVTHQLNRGTSIPRNWFDARVKEDYNEKWLPAMKKQFQSLREKDTWILVDKAGEAIMLDNRWVYDEKYPIGKEAIARARLVIRGDQL